MREGDIWRMGVGSLQRAFAARLLSPREVVEALADRIEGLDPLVSAFTTLQLDRALDDAKRRTEELESGRVRGPLHGVPVGIKELFDVAGAVTSYGSTICRDRVPEEDAEAVRRLRAAGAIIMGLTRSHEFGWGITTQHETLGGTRNPWNRDRVPGGSSGGSAAAVAMGMVPLALGSDTGGSIRIPASLCGVTGLKPSYGRISKRGAVPLAPSLDHVGVIGRDVESVAAGYAALAGDDQEGPSTVPASPDEGSDRFSIRDGNSIRLGIAPALHLPELAPDHAAVFETAIERLRADGAGIEEVSFASPSEIRPAFNVIQMAEAYQVHSADLGLYPARAAEYGNDVRHRLDLASKVTRSEYHSARDRAALIRGRFAGVFEDVDALLTPVAAGGPAAIGRPDRGVHEFAETPFRDVVMGYTTPQNIAGLPACAVPAGWDRDGLPVGIQITAGAGGDAVVIRVARLLEETLKEEEDRVPSIAE